VAFAMQEAAKAHGNGGQNKDRRDVCIRQMLLELTVADAAGQPLPKPVPAK
jgi:hypothetical protein